MSLMPLMPRPHVAPRRFNTWLKPSINGGVMLLRPCPAVQQHMIDLLERYPKLRFTYGAAEQDFFGWWVPPSEVGFSSLNSPERDHLLGWDAQLACLVWHSMQPACWCACPLQLAALHAAWI